jgi:uncharacterized RDD family membrane protein YckC
MMDSTQILDQPLAAESQALNVDAHTAGRGKRLANSIIDGIIYYIILIVVFVVLGAFFMSFMEIADLIQNAGLVYLLTFSVMILYYWGMEVAFGKTVGKMITKTKVVTLDGKQPSSLQILGRTLSRFIPFDAFSFLGDGVGWHDTISKTRVINTK